MIAACPKCGARYRVDESKIGDEGARLRCAKCQAVFRVRPPQAAAAPAAAVDPIVAEPPAPAAAEPPAPAAAEAPSPQVEAPQPQVEAPAAAADAGASPLPNEADIDRTHCVLIAEPNEELGKATASAVASWGLQPVLVHDGVEAMMTIQRLLPAAVVLDAALPKMFGFQICEVMKRNESLSGIRVVLVGAIHNEERYRRPPSETYGADVYLEQPDLPDGLKPLLQQFGLPVDGAPATAPAPEPAAAAMAEPTPEPAAAAMPEPTPEPAAAAMPEPTPEPVAAAEPTGDPALAEEREKAERLARIVVSDIVLYQGEKFDQAIAAGNLLEMLDALSST